MLTYLKIEGTSFEAGLALGRFGAHAVHAYLKHSAAWASVMQWRHSNALATAARLIRERHPEYWEELQGMASGLEMPFDEVLLWNCRGDLWAMAPDGCTTVQLPGEVCAGGYPLFAHNEDGSPEFAGHCAMAEIAVTGRTRFASFVYPGSLPGHTIAVNDAGLAMTVNNLRALHVAPGMPRMVVARAMLDMPDVPAALAYLQDVPRSGGFHFTLAQAGCHSLTSVEFNAGLCSIVEVQQPSLHSNHMVHAAMANQPQIVTGSSGYRQIRGDELIRQAVSEGRVPDPMRILLDQSNKKFPIFRNAPDDSDAENTMASAIIRVGAGEVEWQVHTPGSAEPLYRFRNGARL